MLYSDMFLFYKWSVSFTVGRISSISEISFNFIRAFFNIMNKTFSFNKLYFNFMKLPFSFITESRFIAYLTLTSYLLVLTQYYFSVYFLSLAKTSFISIMSYFNMNTLHSLLVLSIQKKKQVEEKTYFNL